MSVHVIYYQDGAKMMRPVLSREEYLALRGTEKQKAILKSVRKGDERQKHRLVQMNYSCLPNEDGSLKGSTRMSTSVGMDIDHIKPEEMQPLCELILAKKDELGLQMLEMSARGAGYHLVFKRREELSQEDNLLWASQLLGVKYDDGAKDITRVFFTTTDSAEDLLYLDDSIFEITECISNTDKKDDTDMKSNTNHSNLTNNSCSEQASSASLTAFDLCAQQAGLNPGGMDVWGERNWHTNLMAVLSVGVAKLMSRQQLRAVVAERLPNYSQTEDCQKLIDYFYDKYDADKGFMNASLREINAKAQKKASPDPSQRGENDADDDDVAEANSSFFTLTSEISFFEFVSVPSISSTSTIFFFIYIPIRPYFL